MSLSSNHTKIRKVTFELPDIKRSYSFDVNQNIALHTLLKMLICAANLSRSYLRIFYKDQEYTQYLNETLENLFPNEVYNLVFKVVLENNKKYELNINYIELDYKYCPKHEGKYQLFYCYDCKKDFCSDCLTEHNNHNYIEKNDYLQSSKILIDKIFGNLNIDTSIFDDDLINELKIKINEKFFPLLQNLLNKIQQKFQLLITKYILFEKDNLIQCQKKFELLKEYYIEGLDELKQKIKLEELIFNHNVFLLFDKKYRNIKNDTKAIIDINKVNKFKINIDLLSQNLDKMYNDIYAVLNENLNSKIFLDLENEFKINCQLNFPLNKHEILWKLLKETDLQQFIPTKPILADYDAQLKNFNKINPKLDPKYRDKAYVEYYKKYYYIDNLNIRKDPTLDVPNIQPGIQVDIYNTNNNKMKTIRTDEKNKKFNPNQYKDTSNKSNLNAKFDSIANETSNNYPNVSRINDNTYLVGNNNYMNNNNSTNNMNDKYEYLINNQKRN